jgi:hypothetical protein
MKKSIGQSHSIGTAPRLLTIKQVADRLTVSVGCFAGVAHPWRGAASDSRGFCLALGRTRG